VGAFVPAEDFPMPLTKPHFPRQQFFPTLQGYCAVHAGATKREIFVYMIQLFLCLKEKVAKRSKQP